MRAAALWLSFTRIGVMTCGSFQPALLLAVRRNSMKKEYDFSKARRGPVVRQPGKSRITIYLDNDVLDKFRERADSEGRGYQTMINDALREFLGKARQPVDARTLRRILREELRKTG
jgi:uncharacterized protein (DUF4415 family)